MSTSNNNDDKSVKIYKNKNRLKDKLGVRIPTNEPGHIDPEIIDEAQAIIDEMCKGCEEVIHEHLDNLSSAWEEMQKIPASQARTEKSEEIFTISHEIKDIASLCGYNLIAHFAESLRDYISETALNLKNQRIIIQAHVDAMTTVHKNSIKDDGGPMAEELKKMVKIAINKYK